MAELQADSSRERMLEALRTVLADIPGVLRADRQAITVDLVSDAELPAVLIDEQSTQYTWEHRHQGRVCRLQSRLVLDVQVRSRRTQGAPHGDVSSQREALVWLVLNRLANNPTLLCQLDGEAEPTRHAHDILGQAEVRYVEAPFPYGRALVQLDILLHDVFDDRVPVAWQQAVLEAAPTPFTAVAGAQPEDVVKTTTITPEAGEFTGFSEED